MNLNDVNVNIYADFALTIPSTDNETGQPQRLTLANLKFHGYFCPLDDENQNKLELSWKLVELRPVFMKDAEARNAAKSILELNEASRNEEDDDGDNFKRNGPDLFRRSRLLKKNAFEMRDALMNGDFDSSLDDVREAAKKSGIGLAGALRQVEQATGVRRLFGNVLGGIVEGARHVSESGAKRGGGFDDDELFINEEAAEAVRLERAADTTTEEVKKEDSFKGIGGLFDRVPVAQQQVQQTRQPQQQQKAEGSFKGIGGLFDRLPTAQQQQKQDQAQKPTRVSSLFGSMLSSFVDSDDNINSSNNKGGNILASPSPVKLYNRESSSGGGGQQRSQPLHQQQVETTSASSMLSKSGGSSNSSSISSNNIENNSTRSSSSLRSR
jgi:hypothetical protein